MSLLEVIDTTPALQTSARKLAALLSESDAKEVRTEDGRVKWFKYTRSEAWDKDFDNLLEEIQNLANDIKFAVEKCAGVTLRKKRPNEMRPQPTLERLDAGWATIPAGHIGFLVSLAPEDCMEVKLLGNRNGDQHRLAGWLCGSGVVLFERVSLRTEPAGIPYAVILVSTSPMGEE